MRRAAPVLAWLICAALCTVARAQGEATPDEAEAQAKAHYTIGMEAFEREDYEEAVEHYLAAYRLVPRAGVLFNIALSFHLAGEYEDALRYYRLYLDNEPEGEGAADALLAIRELEEKIAQSDPEPAPEVEVEAQDDASSEPAESGSILGSPYLWGGTAFLLSATALYFGLQTRSDQNEFDSLRANSSMHDFEEAAAVRDRGRRNALLTNVFAGLGVAAGAAFVYVIVRPESAQETGSSRPAVGVAVRGSW